MRTASEPLRVAFIAGTLGQGGAERQMSYMIRSLRETGARVRVCSLTEGEHYERVLQDAGVEIDWVGHNPNPAARLAAIVMQLRPFRPHVVQSMHSFANLYAALPAKAVGAVSVGALRCDLELATRDNKNWMKWLMRLPDGLVVNSQFVRRQVAASKAVSADRLYYLANRVDLAYYGAARRPHDASTVIFVGRLVAEKRLDCFLRAVALARRSRPDLIAIVAGDGPERVRAELLAAELKLTEQNVRFLGSRDDMPMLLAQSDMLLMCSETEGSANVLLEAMAASLPVITTPAGDAESLVKEGRSGFLVAHGDVNAMAERIVTLANSPALRVQMGAAGRALARDHFDLNGLSASLQEIYETIGRRMRHPRWASTKSIWKTKSSAAPGKSANLP